MSCLGVHFAMTEPEVGGLRALADERARLDHLQEVIETTYFEADGMAGSGWRPDPALKTATGIANNSHFPVYGCFQG